MSLGIFFIASTHLLSMLMNVRISKGNILLAVLLTLNIQCFAIGITIPMLHSSRFWVIKEDMSLLQVLYSLKQKGEIELYYIMLLFTFIIPILKMIVLAYDVFISKSDGRKSFILSLLSKWAMAADVFVVGIIVSTMKSGSGFVEMTTGAGLTFFIASIILLLQLFYR
jgi:paraquat-inducible protein A